MTFFLQPCDVFVDKPLKDRLRNISHDYMRAQQQQPNSNIIFSLYNIIIGKFIKPSKEQLLLWITESADGLQFEDDAFLNVILRGPEHLQKYISTAKTAVAKCCLDKNQEDNGSEELEMSDESEGRNEKELVFGDEYDFENL